MNGKSTVRKTCGALGAFVAAVCSFSVFAGGIDVTELVRTQSTPTVTRIDGEVRKTSEDVDHAFDGKTVVTEGRVMFKTLNAALQYDIPAAFRPDLEVKIASYTVFRTCSDDQYDLPRAPTQFKLQALVGEEWVTLHEKGSSDPETGWSGSVKSITYRIPEEKRVVSRSYRFVMSANNGSSHEACMSLDELKLFVENTFDPATWDGALPAGYERVDCLESTGSGEEYNPAAYINTKCKPTLDTRITAKFDTMQRSRDWAVFFGALGGDNAQTSIMMRHTSGGDHPGHVDAYFLNSNWFECTFEDCLGKEITVDLRKGALTLNGVTKEIPFGEGHTPPNQNIYIFCGNNNGSAWRGQAMKLYWFGIQEGDEYVRYFVPCRELSSGKLGLYDAIEGEFFGNKGNGSFVDPDFKHEVTVASGEELTVGAKPQDYVQYTVYGTLNLTDNREVLNFPQASLTIKDGGVVNYSGNEGENNGCYGGFNLPKGASVTVEAGGLLDIKKDGGIGFYAEGLIHIDGGTLHANGSTPGKKGYLRNVKLSDGAQITGGSIGAGWCQESYSDRNANRATVTVAGTSPSFVNTSYFLVGAGRGGTYAAVTGNNGKVNGSMGPDLVVNDVTGDAASDLVVNALVTVYKDFTDWPADKLYLSKTGAGTLELAGGVQGLPCMKLGAGAVLVKKTGNTLGALTVTGDSTLAIADGAEIAIGSLVVEGGTLTLDADLKECVVNLGSTDQAVLNSIVYCGKTEALAIDENGRLVSTLVSEAPEIGEVSVEVEDITTAIFTAEIVSFGEQQNAADLYVAVGTAPEELGEFVKIGAGETDATSVSGTVSVAEEGATYYYEAKLQNPAGYFSAKVRSGSFRTTPKMTTLTTGVCYSGLLQGKINTANDFETDILANSVIPLEVVPGVVMAINVVGDGQQNNVFYTNPYTGSEYKWNGSNTTFGYFGEIYLEKDAELHLGKNIDDSGFVKIGETVLIENTGYQDFVVATFTAPETGWYPIEVRIGDGSGGKGVRSTSKFGGFGIAYNIGGTTNPDDDGWALLADAAHDGTFLRHHDIEAVALQMTAVQVDGDDVVVWLGAVGAVGAGTKLVACYGATDGGENPLGWASVREIAVVDDDGELPATKYVLEGLTKYGAVRFALMVPGSETVQGFSQFSPVTEFAQVDPLVGFDFDGDAQAESATVKVNVAALGLGAGKATVYAEVSQSGAFDDTVRTKLGEVSLAGVFTADLSGLTAATTYAVRLVIENDAGKTYTSEAKTFTTYNPNIAHPGDTLTWNGGASGTWDTTTSCWKVPAGGTVAWLDGCVARFVTDAEVTVAEPRTVIGAEVGADVTLKGAAIEFLTPAKIVYVDNGTLRFENEVNAAKGIAFDLREEHDTIYASELTGNLTDGDQLLFRNVKLAEVDALFVHFYGNFGSDHRDKILRSDEPAGSQDGVFYVTKTDTELTGQFQMLCSGAHNIIKVYLYQNGDDIWGRYLYSVSYCTYADYNTNKFKFGDDFDAAVEAGKIGWGYGQTMCDLELRKVDYLPTECRSEFADGYNANKVETVVNAGTLAFCGEQTLNCRLRAQNGGAVEFAKDSFVSIPGSNSCVFYGNPYYIYGTIDAGGGLDNYGLISDGETRKGFYVCAGGRYISRGGYDYYGYDGCKITVLEGGVLETAKNYGIGCNGNEVVLQGGVWEQSYDYRDIYNRAVMLKDVKLSNGAEIKGYIGTMGHDYYNATFNVEVSGNEPCVISLDAIRLGNWNKAINSGSSGSGCHSRFTVADVTGDAASDLIVSSVFEGAANMTVDPGCEQYYELRKCGEGTLELTGANSSAPLCQFQTEKGTVKLGAGASAEFGTFALKGDSALDVTAAGSKLVFADSSSIGWTEGKTLTVVGYHKRAIRFGTDANALTAEQLAQIKFAEKPNYVATLDDHGYLVGPSSNGFKILIR